MSSTRDQPSSKGLRIAVIGGGWYGCYVTKYLYEKGGYRNLTLFEKNSTLITGTSGQAFNRLHVGPHYPRCADTRDQVQSNLVQFSKEFPDLIVDPVNSFYTLGTCDANGKPSLVTPKEFEKVCFERPDCEAVKMSSLATDYHIKLFLNKLNSGHDEQNPLLHGSTLYKMNEPVLYMTRPRKFFLNLFQKYKVNVFLNTQVTCIKQDEDYSPRVHVKFETKTSQTQENVQYNDKMFDYVVNCTYYTNFLSKKICASAGLDRTLGSAYACTAPKVVYEPCISLLYEPPAEWKNTDKNLWSFTVMDGAFPCLMPYCLDAEETARGESKVFGKSGVSGEQKVVTEYVLYHAHYSKLAKIDDYDEAVQYVKDFCEDEKNWDDGENGYKRLKLVDAIEDDFSRYMKDFKQDFKYLGYNVLIRTKLDVEKEFRANFVWRDGKNQRLIQVFSGKITNCVNAAPIVLSLIQKETKSKSKEEEEIKTEPCTLKK